MAGVKKPRPGSNLDVRIAHPGLRELVVTYLCLPAAPIKTPRYFRTGALYRALSPVSGKRDSRLRAGEFRPLEALSDHP